MKPRTIIVHRGERVIPELQHEALSEFAVRKLRQNGVEVSLKTGVKEVSKSEVHLDNGKCLSYGLLAGTVGNTASKFIKESGLPLDKNRLKTTAAMQVEGHDHIWALGDCSVIPNAFDNKPSPATAQFALRQAKQMAANIKRTYQGEKPAPFSFRPQGLLATIGQRNGVAEVYGVKFSGLVAWIFWRGVYLMKMPSFSRKLGIAVDWFMSALFPENVVRIGEPRGQMRHEHYAAGDVIYRQGEPASTLYMLESGSALAKVEGEDEPVARLQQGEHFGLSALEERKTQRSTTIIAESPLTVVALDRPRQEDFSKDMLTREMVRSLEMRRQRQSWLAAVEKFPEVAHLVVSDVMVKQPDTLREEDSLLTALTKLATSISLPVVDSNGKLTAVCSRENVNGALSGGMDLETPVREFSSPAVTALAPDRPLKRATADYLRTGLEWVPVTDQEGRLLGMFGLIEAVQNLLAAKTPASNQAAVGATR